MTFLQAFVLLTMGAIWGGAALCLKVLAPALSPLAVASFRLGIAAFLFTVAAPFLRAPLHVRKNWKRYLLVGALNNAVPYTLFAWSAHDLPASILSVLNALTPFWGVLLGALLRLHPMTAGNAVGLGLGITGVSILTGLDPSVAPHSWKAVLAIIIATLMYSSSALYVKKTPHTQPLADAHGSMWAGFLLSLPALAFDRSWMDVTWTPPLLTAILTLGAMCTAFVNVLFFMILRQIPAKAVMSVAFLIPVFGILWGHLFLNEHVGWNTVVGTLVTLAGTGLVTGIVTLPRRPKLPESS